MHAFNKQAKNPPLNFARSHESPRFHDAQPSKEDMEKINQLAPSPLTADKVYIRSMYLCSTQPCKSDGCQFTHQALEDIACKVIGQSVLAGHNRRSLPLARFFKAQVTQSQENSSESPSSFVRAWFYWLRETSGAKDLLLNIDGGIYREVSLAWKYDHWRCSLCGEENGQCPHRVLQTYDGQTCYRVIDHVIEVVEGSLVYKSADRHTYLSGIHEERGLSENETVILICNKDDPFFQKLQSHNLIENIQPLHELQQSFSASLDPIWLRTHPREEADTITRHFLPDAGVCLVDQTDENQDPRFLMKQQDNIHWLENPSILE